MTDLERVTFKGGPLHGAILEMSQVLAARVAHMELVITDSGNVVDRTRRQMVPGIRVVQRPQPRLPEVVKAPRKRRAREPRTAPTTE